MAGQQVRRSTIVTAVVAAAVGAAISMLLTQSGRARDASTSKRHDEKPNLSGVWQALNEAHWDLEAHDARAGAVTQAGYVPFEYARVPAAPVLALGAAGGVPASLGVVEGDGRIPYKPEAAAVKKENGELWIDFHQLQGEPKRYTIHVNGPWCIVFEWTAQGEAVRVDLVQYH